MVDQSAQRNQIQSFRTAPESERWSPGESSPISAAHGQTMTRPNGGRSFEGDGRGPHHASTTELVSQAAGQITTLVRSELALGKAELVEKGKKLGLGGAMLAAAGLFGLFTLGLLVALFVAVLDRDWPLWLAILVPFLVLGVITLGLAGLGISRLRAGASAPPTAGRVRDDIRSVKDAIREGRNHAGHEGRQGS